jgi:pimeloyl-ACP methyl ester carboxylesterase
MHRVVASVVLGLISQICSPANAADERVTHEYYAVNGAKLYVESIGHGSPVLFLHGGLMFFDNAYAHQIHFFAATHQVIGIDQRGHGHSPDGPWQLTYQMMADDTAAILQKLKIGRVDVVGHSDGANIALLLARDHPELVRRIVVSGANLRGWSLEVLQANQRLPATQIEDKVRRLASSLPAFFVEDYAGVSPDGRDHWMTMVTKCYWLWGQPIVIDPAELKRIEAPALVIAGDHDFTSIEDTTEIFRSLPHGELFLLPGTGHGTFQTRPDLINLAVKEFLEKQNAASIAR